MKFNPRVNLDATTALTPETKKAIKQPALLSTPATLLLLAACNGDGASPFSVSNPIGTTSYNDVVGTSDDDDLFGTDEADKIVGGAGNDILEGGGGDDTLYGGTGDDRLYGDGGKNTLVGGEGDDLFILDSYASENSITNITDFQIESPNGSDTIGLDINYDDLIESDADLVDGFTITNGEGTLTVDGLTLSAAQGTGENPAHTRIYSTRGDVNFEVFLEDTDADDLTASNFEFL